MVSTVLEPFHQLKLINSFDFFFLGKIEFVSLNPELLEGALEVIRKGFFPHESVSIAVNLVNNQEAMAELEGLCIRAAKDGVSVVAIEKTTKKVIGVAFNKPQVNSFPKF